MKQACCCQAQFAASANRGFEFDKRSQLFIRVQDETLSVPAMCVCNPDRSPVPSSIRAALARPGRRGKGTAQRQRERGPRDLGRANELLTLAH
jgi:hypothetical protein